MGIKHNVCEVLYLLQTFCFYNNNNLYYILFPYFVYEHNIYTFFIKRKYKGDTSVKKRKGDSLLKSSSPDCTCANTDYFIARFWCLY